MNRTSFNPFIQVFYFYAHGIMEYDWMLSASFNPFIQVFYFYLGLLFDMLDMMSVF